MSIVVAAECMTCAPWVRMRLNPATNIPVREVLHEERCPTYPRFSRGDIAALVGD